MVQEIEFLVIFLWLGEEGEKGGGVRDKGGRWEGREVGGREGRIGFQTVCNSINSFKPQNFSFLPKIKIPKNQTETGKNDDKTVICF